MAILRDQGRLSIPTCNKTMVKRSGKMVRAFGLLLLLAAGVISAQTQQQGLDSFQWFLDHQNDPSVIANLLNLGLPQSSGYVPVTYSQGAKTVALRYQKSVDACARWYERQVGVRQDFRMAVLNQADWKKVTRVPYPMPHDFTALTVLPTHIEEVPGSKEVSGDIELLGEAIACHEAGHVYAKKLNMPTANNFMAELYANVFAVAYMRSKRPDMAVAFLQGPPPKMEQPRYNTIADFEFLGEVRVGGESNVAWFEFQVFRLCDRLLQGKSLRSVLDRLKTEFQDAVDRPPSVVADRLESIQPGLGKAMGAVWRPTTLPQAKPGCDNSMPDQSKPSSLIIENSSSEAVVLTGAAKQRVKIPANSFITFDGHAGEQVKIDHGDCFMITDEPSLAAVKGR